MGLVGSIRLLVLQGEEVFLSLRLAVAPLVRIIWTSEICPSNGADQMTTTTEQLDADVLGQAAVAKMLAKGVKGLALEPGRYEVDTEITLRFAGEVLRSEDCEYTPTAHIPLVPVMALLLQRAGIDREASEALIVRCATDALECGGSVAGELEERIDDAEVALATLKARFAASLPKEKRKGPTKISGKIQVVSQSTTAIVVE